MKRFCCFLLCLILLPAALNAADFGPWEAPEQASATPAPAPGAVERLVILFQRWISPVDGARCSMTPTCSAYARQALQQHGPLLGSFITVDRLIHEGDPVEREHPVVRGDFIRFHDPLEENDFWLYR